MLVMALVDGGFLKTFELMDTLSEVKSELNDLIITESKVVEISSTVLGLPTLKLQIRPGLRADVHGRV